MQMKAIEYYIDRAEYVLQAARQRPPKRRHPSGPSKWKSLSHKLNDLFVDESEKEPENKKLRSSVHLLDKLVTKEKLTCLVVNLYPGNKGYSLMLKGKNGIDSETIKLPYEESDLLDYLDTEELPPILVDLLERSQANVFYNGCVIAEVRDFRRTANSKTYESHHVLLRPTAQTLVCDVNAITNDGEHRWTQDDKHELEKQLVLATAEPLCLDPSPVVAVVSNRIQHHRLKFSTKPLKRCAKRFSQTAANRRKEMTTMPAPPHLFLHDFLQKKKEKRPHPPVDLKCVDMWKQRSLNLSAPSHVEVENYASALERPKSTSDNTPITVEEVVLEAERSNNKILHSRVTIQQRPTDNFYQGELYVDRDHQPGDSKRESGTSCKFPLGSKVNAQRYIQQYKDLFTEEGRRSVKIAHIIPGQPPQITHTQTPNPNTPTQIVFPGGGQGLLTPTGSTISPGGATQYNRPLPKGSRALGNKPKSFSGGSHSSSSSSKSKRPPPIKLSLSLNNTGSLSSNLMSPPGDQGDAGTPTSSAGLGASQPSPTISMGAPLMTPTMAMSRSLGRQIPVYPLPGHSVISPTDGVGTPPLASSGAAFPPGTMKTPKTPPPLRPGSAPGAPSGQHSLPNILSRRQSVPEITQGGAQGQGSVSITSSKVPTPSGTPTGTPTGTPKPSDAPPTPSTVPTPTQETMPINIIGTMAQAGGIGPTITTTTSGGLVSMRIPMCVTMVSGTPTAVVTTPSGVITTPINLSGTGPGIMTGAINIIGGAPIGGSISSSIQGTAASSQQVTAAPINITAGMAAQGINPALAPQFLATGLKNAPQGLRPGTAPLSLLQHLPSGTLGVRVPTPQFATPLVPGQNPPPRHQVQGQQPQLIPFNPQALQGRPLNQATLQQLQAQGQLPQGVPAQQIQLNAQQLQQIQQFQQQALQQSQSSPQSQATGSDQPQQSQQIQQSLLQQFQHQQLQQALLLQQQQPPVGSTTGAADAAVCSSSTPGSQVPLPPSPTPTALYQDPQPTSIVHMGDGIQGQMQQIPQGQQQLAPMGYQKPPSSLTVQQQLQQSIQQRQTSKSKSRKRTTPTPPKQS